MRLKTEENFVLSNSNSNEKRFTINASAKAFKILSSSLYENKIRAIVRELSCNALDSHKMAGWPERPFTIHIPNSWDMDFYVEDYGIGLNNEDIENTCISFFASIKTESNDLIGGLGLGMKTPFSYTDTFSIRSRKDGIEYNYNAYINANGEPAVSLISSHKTEEPNGVRITVPVKSEDIYKFSREAQRVFEAFEVLPEVLGSHLDLRNDLYKNVKENKGFYHNAILYSSSAISVLMGNVEYNVFNSNVKAMLSGIVTDQNEFESIAKFLDTNQISIGFEIGDLDVAASRETISFDEESTKIFVDKFLKCIRDVFASDQIAVDEHGNVLEAANYIIKKYGQWALGFFTYQTTPIISFMGLYVGSDVISRILQYGGYKPSTTQILSTSSGIRSSFYRDSLIGDGTTLNKLVSHDRSIVFVENVSYTRKKHWYSDIPINRTAIRYILIDDKLSDKMKDIIKMEFGIYASFVDMKEVLEKIREARIAARKEAIANTPKQEIERKKPVRKNQARLFFGAWRLDNGDVELKIYDNEKVDIDESMTNKRYIHLRAFELNGGYQLYSEAGHAITLSSAIKVDPFKELFDNTKDVDAVYVSQNKDFARNNDKIFNKSLSMKEITFDHDYILSSYMLAAVSGWITSDTNKTRNNIIYKLMYYTYDNLSRYRAVLIDHISEIIKADYPHIENTVNVLMNTSINKKRLNLTLDSTIISGIHDQIHDAFYKITKTIIEKYPLLEHLPYGVPNSAVEEYVELVDFKTQSQ